MILEVLMLTSSLATAQPTNSTVLTIETIVYPEPVHKAAGLGDFEIISADQAMAHGFACTSNRADEKGRLLCTLQCGAEGADIFMVELRMPFPPAYDRPVGRGALDLARPTDIELVLRRRACEISAPGREISRIGDQFRLLTAYLPEGFRAQKLAAVEAAAIGGGGTTMTGPGRIEAVNPSTYAAFVSTHADSDPGRFADAAEALRELNYTARLIGDEEIARWSSQAYFETLNAGNRYLWSALLAEEDGSASLEFDARTPDGLSEHLAAIEARAALELAREDWLTRPDSEAFEAYLQDVQGLRISLEGDPQMSASFLENYRDALQQRAAVTATPPQ